MSLTVPGSSTLPPAATTRLPKQAQLVSGQQSADSTATEQKRLREAHVKQIWEKIAKATKVIISQHENRKGRVFEHLGERGFVGTKRDHTILINEREGLTYPLVINRVGENCGASYPINTVSEPKSEKEGNLIANWVSLSRALVVDLRTKDEIDLSREAYKPILGVTQSIQVDILATSQVCNPSAVNDLAPLRYAFTDWRDGDVIVFQQLHKIVLLISGIMEERKNICPSAQLLVHCRSGVGRTGTLITALLLHKAIQEKLHQESISSSQPADHSKWLGETIERMILQMREERSSWFVQKEPQLKLIYKYGQWLLGGVQKEESAKLSKNSQRVPEETLPPHSVHSKASVPDIEEGWDNCSDPKIDDWEDVCELSL